SAAAPGVAPPKPLVTIATISTQVAAISVTVARPIGRRESLRSVRYQWPRNRPSYAAPRNAAPATSWNSENAYPWRPVAAIATSTASDTETPSTPSTRAAAGRRATKPRNARVSATAGASPSRTDQAPAPSPGDDP